MCAAPNFNCLALPWHIVLLEPCWWLTRFHTHFCDPLGLPAWPQEMEADAHIKDGHAGAVTLRAFRNAAGSLRGDLSEGCDSWAVGQGWVAVTPICLRSGEAGLRGLPGAGATAGDHRLGSAPCLPPIAADMPLTAAAAAQREQAQVLLALTAAMQAAAKHLGARVAGIPHHLQAAVAAAALGAAPQGAP